MIPQSTELIVFRWSCAKFIEQSVHLTQQIDSVGFYLFGLFNRLVLLNIPKHEDIDWFSVVQHTNEKNCTFIAT